MTWYTFGPYPAVNPDPASDGRVLVYNGSGLIYDKDDIGLLTPLPVQGVGGDPLAVVTSSAIGEVNAFRVEDHPRVLWKSGDYVIPLESWQGLEEAAMAAQAAAEASAGSAADSASDSASSAAAAAANSLPLGGTAGQVLAKVSNTDRDAGWITPAAGGGSNKGYLVLGTSDPIPGGTLAGTLIARVTGVIPDPTHIDVPLGAGNVTAAGAGIGTTPLDMPIPVNRAVGDVLMYFIASQSSATGPEWPALTGWTKAYESQTFRRYALYYKTIPDLTTLNALPASVSITNPSEIAATRLMGTMIRVTGADLTTTFLGRSGFGPGGTNGDLTVPTFTATASAGAVFAFATTNTSTGSPACQGVWAGMTEITDYTFVSPSTNAMTGITLAWTAATGTAIAAHSATFNPIASAITCGCQFALKQVV